MELKKRIIDIIIPTFNNEEFLNPCVISILNTGILNDHANLIIVNNGKQDIERSFGGHPAIKIINTGQNLGWEGGLKEGLKYSPSDYVVFQNDDTTIPVAQSRFYLILLNMFNNQTVAAVGPATTVCAGPQSIYHPNTAKCPVEVSYLIFFCVMIRKKYLEEVGGIDDTLPGGDDFDLSIRLRSAGYSLVIQPQAFLIHHAFKTGTRVKGDHTMKGGWNSIEMSDRTNHALIVKHGFKKYFSSVKGLRYDVETTKPVDSEGNMIASSLNGQVNILELGCGTKKTVEKAIGVDIIPKGEQIPNLGLEKSIADVVADVQLKLPFDNNSQDTIIARHVLEHCIDPVKAVLEWKSKLKIGGELIVAVPNSHICQSIPMNPEHCHAFTPSSLKTLMNVCGLEEERVDDPKNGISFVGWYRRVR